MKKTLKPAVAFVLYTICFYNAVSQITSFNYLSSGLSTTACNVFNPTVNINGVPHSSLAGGVSFNSVSGLNLVTTPQNTPPGATAFIINYNFAPGNKYDISITAKGNDALILKSSVVPNLIQFPTNGTASCTADGYAYSYLPVGLGQFSTPTSKISATYSIPQFTVTGTTIYPYMIVWASGGSIAIDALSISNITIVQTPLPTFTITPQSVTIPCGTSTQQTFTVNNVYGSPGTLSYDWNLGSTNNGWLYLGSAAPPTFTTTNNSITLTSSNTATSLSNVNVTVKLNGNNYTTLTANVTLGTPTFNFLISGDDIICNSSVYSISGLPNGASIAWSIPGSAGSVLQLAQNSPTTNQLTITNQKWYGVSTTLTANITGLTCSLSSTATKLIINDNSTSATEAFPYSQEACTFYNVSHPSQSGTAYSNSSPTFVHQGCMVYVNLGNMTNRTVVLAPGSGQPLYWNFGVTSYYQNTLYFQLPLGSGGTPFNFEIRGNGACYNRTLSFFSYSNNSRYAYTVSPNPSRDLLTVTVKENNEYLRDPKQQSSKEIKPFTMNIYDVSTNTMQLSQHSNIGSLKHQINISKLKKGYYILQIVNSNETQSIKFLKE